MYARDIIMYSCFIIGKKYMKSFKEFPILIIFKCWLIPMKLINLNL